MLVTSVCNNMIMVITYEVYQLNHIYCLTLHPISAGAAETVAE